MKPVIDYRVYLVTDTVYFNDSNVWNKLEAALAGGVTLVQYRDKTASSRTLYERALKMKALCDKYRVPMLVDDRADIAFAVGAAGVHVGQDDLPSEQARRIWERTLLSAYRRTTLRKHAWQKLRARIIWAAALCMLPVPKRYVRHRHGRLKGNPRSDGAALCRYRRHNACQLPKRA